MNRFRQWMLVALFALAMAWVEAAAVMYLRLPADRVQPYQPNPLPTLPTLGVIEPAREVATLLMLAAVGTLAGRDRPSRFGFFLIAFGLWDLSYYLFLRWMGGWPASVLDWDILFLIPLPWWGPVLAPALISLLMISLGALLIHPRLERSGREVPRSIWVSAACGALLAIGIFTWDAALAVPQGTVTVLRVLPEKFLWPQFLAALGLMSLPLAALGRRLVQPAFQTAPSSPDRGRRAGERGER